MLPRPEFLTLADAEGVLSTPGLGREGGEGGGVGGGNQKRGKEWLLKGSEEPGSKERMVWGVLNPMYTLSPLASFPIILLSSPPLPPPSYFPSAGQPCSITNTGVVVVSVVVLVWNGIFPFFLLYCKMHLSLFL